MCTGYTLFGYVNRSLLLANNTKSINRTQIMSSQKVKRILFSLSWPCTHVFFKHRDLERDIFGGSDSELSSDDEEGMSPMCSLSVAQPPDPGLVRGTKATISST